MNPDRHLSSHYDYFLDLIRGDDGSAESHRQFYDEYNAVLDLPAEYYLDTIKTVFQDFALVNGSWEVGGALVRPQDITTSAMLTIEGELDDISGAGQTRAAHELCTGIPKGRQFHYDVEGAGHYGIFAGRRWREKVYPEVKAFIARFNQLAQVLNVEPAAARTIVATPTATRRKVAPKRVAAAASAKTMPSTSPAKKRQNRQG
jgi:poly(3-hydroxybutyrate) depolymerase